MNISLINQSYFNKKTNSNNYKKSILNGLQKDSFELSFNGLRKKDFSGIDLMIVELFKAPIEKFAGKDDFNSWAQNHIDRILASDYTARTIQATAQRKAIIGEWSTYLADKNGAYFENKPLQLLILSSITNGLKKDNDKTPPVLNGGALAKSIEFIEQELEKNPKSKFNFLKIYNSKLQEIYASISYDNSNEKGNWVVIPSFEHDKENFHSNVEKLKALSHPNWCTASTQAEPYLKNGDFHIYMVDGKPKVGIRFEDDNIVEIQGQRNNSHIPLLYSEEIKDYTQKNGLKGLEDSIQNAVETAKRFTPLKDKIKSLMEKKDYEAIFNCPEFNCEAQTLDSGKLKVKRFIFDDLEFFGINPNELMSAVEIVDGDLNLEFSGVTRLESLKEVKGNLDLSNSSIKNTGSLQKVRGELKIDSTKTEIGDNLCIVGKRVFDVNDPYGYESYLDARVLINRVLKAKNKKEIFEALGIKVKELDDGTLKISSYNPSELEKFALLRSYTSDPFETIGMSEEDLLDGVSVIVGDLNLEESSIETLKTVKKVGGDVNLKKSNLISLGSLGLIKGNLLAEGSSLRSLGNLQVVGKNAHLSNTAIKSTRYLKKVGENLYLNNTDINELRYLTGENLGGNIYIDSYSFPSLDEKLYALGLENKTIID